MHSERRARVQRPLRKGCRPCFAAPALGLGVMVGLGGLSLAACDVAKAAAKRLWTPGSADELTSPHFKHWESRPARGGSAPAPDATVRAATDRYMFPPAECGILLAQTRAYSAVRMRHGNACGPLSAYNNGIATAPALGWQGTHL
jgi:hypothetical protein